MKRFLKNITKKCISKIGHIFGYEINITRFGYQGNQNQNQNQPNLWSFFSLLKQINFAPKHIIDVGANHGNWTREAIEFFPDCYYSLLEPQQNLIESIQPLLNNNPKIKLYQVGAGAHTGNFKFTVVDRDDSCTFLYSKQEADEKGFQQLEVPMITLNELIDMNHDYPLPDIIKIDAEGLDLEVLKGASHLFGKTEIFIVEAGVVNNIFPNSLFEVVKFMEEKSYKLFDITQHNRAFNPPVLWLTELVFIRKNGKIDSLNFPKQFLNQ